MNGHPTATVVAIGLPTSIPVTWIKNLYRGIGAAARKYGAPIVGGDTVHSPNAIVISVSMLGEVRRGRTILRSGAGVGDLIIVSGTLGNCAAALFAKSVKRGADSGPSSLFRKFQRPHPRFDIIERLEQQKLSLSSMIDISDGLVSELTHLAEMSGVRCAVDASRIPQSPALKNFATKHRQSSVEWALHSGEEYELLMTCPAKFQSAIKSIRGVHIIGEVRRGKGVVDSNGKILVPRGFKHF
jgi:thiamine-monophosphate kinase